jgi:hypothetical protein
MIDPLKDFRYCLDVLEIASNVTYCVMALAIYCLAGQYTASPALSKAPLLITLILYGHIMLDVISSGLDVLPWCDQAQMRYQYASDERSQQDHQP